MDIRKYFSVKTPDSEASSGEESDVEKHEGESSLVLAEPSRRYVLYHLYEMGKAISQHQRRVDRKGKSDWNHASELIKQHESSRWHKDSVITARMAQQCEQQSVSEMFTYSRSCEKKGEKSLYSSKAA